MIKVVQQLKQILPGIAGCILLSSCAYDFPEAETDQEVINSPVNFSSFYVIGDTYASGYMDGALYSGGQEYSYPNIVAGKLEAVLDEPQIFRQALIDSESGYNPKASDNTGSIRGKFKLQFRNSNSIYPARASVEGEPVASWSGSVSSLNDFSFPHLKSYEIINEQKLKKNIYAERLNLQEASVTSLVTEQAPGLVLVNLGYDDILAYALQGASGQEDPAFEEIAANDLTPVKVFEQLLETITTEILEDSEAEIFLANIFNILEAPYFCTISHALETERYSAGYISSAGSHYTEFNDMVFQYNKVEDGGVPANRQRPAIIFDAQGYPAVNARNRARVIIDEYMSEAQLNDGTNIPKWRQMSEEEIVLYKNEPALNENSELSAQVPLVDEQVLTVTEIDIIKDRINAFNTVIENFAESHQRIHLVDMWQIVEEIKNEGYSIEGVVPSLKFERSSIFSSDGYTLNPKGNAIVANEVIRVINRGFNATLLPVDPNSYRGIAFIDGGEN